jgi:PAS domain S-box-containing protein
MLSPTFTSRLSFLAGNTSLALTNPTSHYPKYLRAAGSALLVFVAYYVGAEVGFALTFRPYPISTLWPPNSILLAALLLTPKRSWWWILLAAFPAHLAVELRGGVPTLMILSWFISNAGEALIGALFICYLTDEQPLRFDNLRHVTIFVSGAVIFAPFATSFLDSAFVTLIGWGNAGYWHLWRMRFASNALAALTLVPVIMMTARVNRADLSRATFRRWIEAILFATGLVTVVIFAFGERDVPLEILPTLVYAPLPFLLWAAVRFGPGAVSGSLMFTAFVSIWGTIHGRGPFTTLSPFENVFSLQMFLILMTVPAMFLAAVIEGQREGERALRESEERYREVVETQTELICRFLPDTTLTFVNDAYCRYFKKSRDRLIGTKFIQLVSAPARESVLQSFDSLIESTGTQTREHEVIRPDGSRGWHQWSNHAITNGGGRVVELQGIGRDITVRKLAEEELRVSEERFAKAFNANPQPMTLTTLAEGRFIDANESFVSTLGYCRDEVLGHTATELNIWETPEVRDDLVKRLKEHGCVPYMEAKFRTRSGAFRVFLSSAELIEIAGEECILVASSNITERKHLEEALRRSEREFSTLVENSPDVISRLDRELRYTYISPTLERISGVRTDEFIGKTPQEIAIPGYDWSGFESSCREVFSTGKTVVREFTYRERKYRTRIIPEFSPDASSIESVIAISEDVTERLRAEQELADLTVRLFTLQDEERRRIARELHDGAAQNMFGITISLANLQQNRSDEAETSRIVNECQSLAEQSLQELRTLSYLLHPPILDQAGLVLALQWYVEGFAKRSGIYVDLIALEDIGRLPSEVETALFRIVQESLTNVRRHSGSETASIRLEKKANEVTLQITDRGIGIPRNGSPESSEGIAELGVGIPGMRQRLRQLGGRLQIESTDHGTTIIAVVPASEGTDHGEYSAG